jgi:uncharacterized protein YbaR (Trm112 family)/ubiquinone/menaquinone biosynthesis C-methylase UbiE
VKHSLLDYIVCPEDKRPLRLQTTNANDQEVIAGNLSCAAGHSFPITDGIPRLLSPDALADAARQTQQSFSAKWKRIPNFGHEEASRQTYVRWYLERYGFGTIENLRDFLADKKMILDAGTGLGRDAMLYGENSRAQTIALDISESINFAYQHAGRLPNVHLLQADLTRLPCREGGFDYLACDQVMHHTPDTKTSFDHLVRHLAPGGQIAFYVYKKKGPIREFSDDFLRARYTQASEEECYAFSRAMTSLGKALSDLNAEFEVPEDIPILDIKAGRHNLQRFIYWHIFKCYWNDDLDFETNVMTNFDWYHPRNAHRHTPEEVRGWCAEAGLETVHFNVIESGISVRARKPQENR